MIVLWAQRSSATDAEKNYVYLTIGVPDVPAKSLKLDLKPSGLDFTGTSDSKKTTYHVHLDFYADIDPENSKTHHTAANIQLVLRKKELDENYWPRLLKDKAKAHFLRTDFDKVNSLRGNNVDKLTLRSGSMRTNKMRRRTRTT